MRTALVLLAVGLAVGLLMALTTAHGLATFLKRELFQVYSVDPAAFLAASFVICTTTLLAALVPARRASKVDPMKALRCD
jgi:putative ABC transport system permease protein